MRAGTVQETPQKAVPWTFLSNHSHVLICLANEPYLRLRDVAEMVGITERSAQRIVMELEQAGVLARCRVGRRNSYVVHVDQPLRHPVERHCTVADLLKMVNGELPQVTIDDAAAEDSEASTTPGLAKMPHD